MDAAIKQWQEVLEINPNLIESRNNLGTAYAQKGQIREAVSQWTQTLMKDPANSVALANMAGVLIGKGDISGAINYFEKALPNSENPDRIREQLNLLYEKREAARVPQVPSSM